jgi:hypothetical protein
VLEHGRDGHGTPLVAALPRRHYAMLLCCWVCRLSKSNKKARFLGRADGESDCALDSTHPRRALDLSP